MADIQIPQRTAPAVQFQPPDLSGINALWSRPTGPEQVTSALNSTVNNYLDQYYKRQQLKASAFEAGGPYLMNMLYGSQNQAPPQNQSMAASAPTSPQSATPIASTGSPAIQQPGVAQGQPQIPETIQASLDHPTLGVHAQKILGLQNQMAQNSIMGGYGAKQNQAVVLPQLTAEKALMEGEQFQQGQARQQKQFEDSQAAEESRFQRQEENKRKQTVAGAAEGQKETVGNIKLIDNAFVPLQDALRKNKPTPLADVRARITEAAGTAKPYGIPLGSKTANDVNEAASNMKAALSTEITRSGRFTPYVAEQLLSALVPTAKDTNWQEKLGRIQNFRNALASGVAQNIDNAANAILKGSVSIPKMPTASANPQMQSFGSVAEAENAGLPKGTIVLIGGRRARVD